MHVCVTAAGRSEINSAALHHTGAAAACPRAPLPHLASAVLGPFHVAAGVLLLLLLLKTQLEVEVTVEVAELQLQSVLQLQLPAAAAAVTAADGRAWECRLVAPVTGEGGGSGGAVPCMRPAVRTEPCKLAAWAAVAVATGAPTSAGARGGGVLL